MDLQAAIYRYCNYQERCHREVRNKLYELGATTPEVEALLAEVIEQGLLNEERYARAIARGRFRLKQWGKVKIVQLLKQNQVSAYCIREALKEIDPDDYWHTLQKLAQKKWQELRSEKQLAGKKAKLYRYLLQKGYESDLIKTAIDDISMRN